MIDNGPLAIYRHVKTGGLYLVLGECLIESDKTEAVIYKSMINGQVWVRPSKEFFDGRFQLSHFNNTRQTMNLIDPQPAPIPNNNPSIHDLVCSDLQRRKEFGIKKYRVPLQAGNGRIGLIDLYQELLDAICYCRLLIEELGIIKED